MEACSAMVMIVELRINQVSLQFFMAFVSGVDFVFQQCNLEQVMLMPERLLEPFPGEGRIVSSQVLIRHSLELKTETCSG